MDEALFPIFIVEMSIFIFGLASLFFEMKTLKPVIFKKETISLIGILVFTNFVYFMRAFGIYTNDPNIRQVGPALSAFIAALFLIKWGSLSTNIKKWKSDSMFTGVFLGVSLFLSGALIDNIFLSLLGIFLLAIIPIVLIAWLFKVVFNATSYVKAKKRIFLMTLAFSFIIIFEGVGVVLMRGGKFNSAAVAFGFELPARFMMTLSITLPLSLQNYLNKFIK